MSNFDHLSFHASEAEEAIRELNHCTRRTMPAPVVYELLGNLKCIGHGLPQLLGQLAAGLERSLTEYDVYDHNRGPEASVALATALLSDAALHAAQVGDLLDQAQAAINLQGYNLRIDQPDDTAADQEEQA